MFLLAIKHLLHQRHECRNGILVVNHEHPFRALHILEISGKTFVDVLAAKRLLGIGVVANAKHIRGEHHQVSKILRGLVSRHNLRLIITEIVVGQAGGFLSLRCGIALDDSAVTLVSDILTDTIFIVRHQNALAMTAILGV